MAEKKLTAKEQVFVEHYAANSNASEAARKAGYSEKTATVIASQNLAKPHIQEAILKLTLPAQQDRLDNIAGRRAWLMDVINGKICDQVKNSDGDIVDIAPKLSDRIKALDLLGKTHGDFIDRQLLTQDVKNKSLEELIAETNAFALVEKVAV